MTTVPPQTLLAAMTRMVDEGRNIRFTAYERVVDGEKRMFPRGGHRLDWSVTGDEQYQSIVKKLTAATLEKALMDGLLRSERFLVDQGDGRPPVYGSYTDAILTPAGRAMVEEHRWRLSRNEHLGYAILKPESWRPAGTAAGPAMRILRSTESRHYVDPVAHGSTDTTRTYDGRLKGNRDDVWVAKENVLVVVMDESEIAAAVATPVVEQDALAVTYREEIAEVEALAEVQAIRSKWRERRRVLKGEDVSKR